MKNKYILKINNITKSFPGVIALDKVSLKVRKGEIHGIVGENGAGKSTLMKILSGVYKPDSGSFEFDGSDEEISSPIESLEKGISIIYQEFNLVNTMTIGENIYLGRFGKFGGLKGVHQKAELILDSIGFKVDTRTYVGELSTSQKQMVEIAKALSFEAKLLIMDEPSSSLSSGEMKILMEIIRDLKTKGITIIYISHKLDEIFELCDSVTILRDGQIIDSSPVKHLSREDMIAKMIGRPLTQEYPILDNVVSNEVVLSIKNLNTSKLNEVNFELKKGEILGLVGLMGAGRTEIIRAIFGADKVSECNIELNKEKKIMKTPRDAISNGIGLISEDRKEEGLILSFSVEENVALGNLDKIKKHFFVDKSILEEKVDKRIEELNIRTPSKKSLVSTLSGGNQQKVVIARWLEKNANILLMDEPTRGIDVGAKYEIYLLMKNFVENGGSIIFISSELPEVLNMSNRLLIITDGKITGEFDPRKVDSKIIMDRAIG